MRARRNLIVLLSALLAALLFGCAAEPAPGQEDVPETVNTEESGTAQEDTTEQVLPYLQRIGYAGETVFDGPGYDYCFAGVVDKAGTYTIVEEKQDAEGNLWGRLKSGLGWVDLTGIRSREEDPPGITVNFAGKALLESGEFHHYIDDESEYAVKIVFYANEPLTDLVLFSMVFAEENYEPDGGLYRLAVLDAAKPLVAELLFPGDMSMYGIRFAESGGEVRTYTVSISGRNGTLVLSPYEG